MKISQNLYLNIYFISICDLNTTVTLYLRFKSETLYIITLDFTASRYMQAQQPPAYTPPQGPVYQAPPPMYTPQYGNYNWVPFNTFPNAPPGR